MAYQNKGDWQLTCSRGVSSNHTSTTYFKRDTKYKSYIRYEHRLTNCYQIDRIRVERTNKYSLQPTDSFKVVLKVQGVQEQYLGTIDCVTPFVEAQIKKWCGNINKSNVYVRVYVYQKASGDSSSRAYQSAADNYTIFMSELKEIWRKQLVDTLIEDKIMKEHSIAENEELNITQFYDIGKKLHKHCKSNAVWADMESAFIKSFGPRDANMANRNRANMNSAASAVQTQTRRQPSATAKHSYFNRHR